MQTLINKLGDATALDITVDETLLRQLEAKLGTADTKELLRLLTQKDIAAKDNDGGEAAYTKLTTALTNDGTPKFLQLVSLLDGCGKLQEFLDLMYQAGEYL